MSVTDGPKERLLLELTDGKKPASEDFQIVCIATSLVTPSLKLCLPAISPKLLKCTGMQ